MERIVIIALSAGFGTAFYYWFSLMIQKKSMQHYVLDHQWLLHPNSI